jgi:hypothetical protein
VSIEYDDPKSPGKRITMPAYRWMRNTKTKREMPPMTWIFTGSKVMEDGRYAADTTGYVITVVNFDLTLIDIPDVASNSNETLEWERNPDVAPSLGTKVTMVIEPAGETGDGGGQKEKGAAKEKAELRGVSLQATAAVAQEGAQDGARDGISDVAVDERRMNTLREHWARVVRPHAAALREAAQAHYEVIDAMRREQQRLIDEADRIQRAIDALEKEYQDFTTPRPGPTDASPGEAPAQAPAEAPAQAPAQIPAGQ